MTKSAPVREITEDIRRRAAERVHVVGSEPDPRFDRITRLAARILGVPIVFLFIGAIIGKETMERQQRILRMKRFRREAQAQRVDFDSTDRRTVV